MFSSAKSSGGDTTGIRIVVVGEPRTGKSSLIESVASKVFPHQVPPVLRNTVLPADFSLDRIPVTIIDTSARTFRRRLFIQNFKQDEEQTTQSKNSQPIQDQSIQHDTTGIAAIIQQELKLADAVIFTYACDQPETLDPLTTFWLPELRKLQVKVPVIVAGCKLDAREDKESSLEQVMSLIMQQFREIVSCIECSARSLIQVSDVFYYAQRAVIHPVAPLFDQESQSLQHRVERALHRIFTLCCDHDRDGALNDAEFNDFQPSEIETIKSDIKDALPCGVCKSGLTLSGFLVLHYSYLKKGRTEYVWTVLRKFGYDNEIKLRDDLVSVPFKGAPDQSVELTNKAVEFLKEIFCSFVGDGVLYLGDLARLFLTAPESPWDESPYKDAAEKTALGRWTFNGFLSQWSLMTLLDPSKSWAYLMYIGYPGGCASALHLTRPRRADRKKQHSERNVYQCFVFGPIKAGKSALLNSFLGRPFSKDYTCTTEGCFAVNVVDRDDGEKIKKILILQEVPENGVGHLLSTKESLAACDVAVFVYDSSDEHSWKKARDMVDEVASHCEGSGYKVPFLMVAAKGDLKPYSSSSTEESVKVTQEFGIEAPIEISINITRKFTNLNKLWCKIISTAEQPHLNIPESQAERRRRLYRRDFVNRSLVFLSTGAFFGLTAYRVHTALRIMNNPSLYS